MQKAFEILATYKESEDMINIGAYSKGANKNIDYAIDKIDSINTFLNNELKNLLLLKIL